MCRLVAHISVALFAFTFGFLTAGGVEQLSEAVPLALCVFAFTRVVPELRFGLPHDFDSHRLKVAALTLLLWIPVLVAYLPLIIPQSGLGNCTPGLP